MPPEPSPPPTVAVLRRWSEALPAQPGSQLRLVGGEAAIRTPFGAWTPLVAVPVPSEDVAAADPHGGGNLTAAAEQAECSEASHAAAAGAEPARQMHGAGGAERGLPGPTQVTRWLAPDVACTGWGQAWLLERAWAGAAACAGALAQAVVQGVLDAAQAHALDRVLAEGGNVLLVGPHAACAPLALALAGAGARPAALAAPASPATASPFVTVPDATGAQRLGCDRLAVVGAVPKAMAQALQHASGAVGHLEGRGIGRGLMRFEAAARGRDATLAVLASVDVVVDVRLDPTPRVAEVAELVLTDEGYRPRALVVGEDTGAKSPVSPAADAAAAPADPAAAAPGSWFGQARAAAAALKQAGGPADWEDDLDGTPYQAVAGQPHAGPVLPRPLARTPSAPRAAAGPAATRRVAVPAAEERPSPGWELDRLEEEGAAGEADVPNDALPLAEDGDGQVELSEAEAREHATMAASFGLGPPTRTRTRGDGDP